MCEFNIRADRRRHQITVDFIYNHDTYLDSKTQVDE